MNLNNPMKLAQSVHLKRTVSSACTFPTSRRYLCSQCFEYFRKQNPSGPHPGWNLRQSRARGRHSVLHALLLGQRRRLATVSHGEYVRNLILRSYVLIGFPENPDAWGPLNEYDERVHSHRLREDEHQRGIGSVFEHGPLHVILIHRLRNCPEPPRSPRHAYRLPCTQGRTP